MPDSDPWNVDPPCFDPSLPPEPGEPDMPELVVVPDEPEEEASGEQEWPTPADLVYYADPIPTDALGPILGPMVRAVAVTFQVPTDLAVTLALPIITIAAYGRWSARIKAQQEEVICLATMSILESGARKTPTQNCLAEPLRLFEEQASRDAGAARRAAKRRHDDLEDRVKSLRRRVAQAGDPETLHGDALNRAVQLQREYDTVAAELDAHEVPALPRFIVNNITPERLTTIMAEQDGAIGVLSDEGSGLFGNLGGRYSGGLPNLDTFLSGWSGSPIGKDRVSDGDSGGVLVPRPRLSVCLALQPETLAGLKDKPEFRTSGLLARFLPAMPESPLGYRAVGDEVPDIPEDILTTWNEAIYALADKALSLRTDARALPAPARGQKDTRGRIVLGIKSGAVTLLHDFERRIEPQLRDDGVMSTIKDIGGKLPGQAVRIASALTLLADPNAEWIDEDTMADAIRVTDGYIAHARVALGTLSSGGAPNTPLARVAAWVIEQGKSSINHREAHAYWRDRAKWARTTADMLALMQGLEAKGYVRMRTQKAQGATKRGRPSTWWDVNPTLLIADGS